MAGKLKKKPVMLKVLKAENNVLDSIIVRQGVIHDTVVAKDWVQLEDAMIKMERLSARFMELEEQRMNIEQETALSMREIEAKESEDAENAESEIPEETAEAIEEQESESEEVEDSEEAEPLVLTFEERAFLYGDRRVSDTLSKVRTKLARSKIENNALNAYVSAANGFLQGVFDKIVPQRKNTVYNRYGKMAKPSMQSLVIDRVF
jgi:hypothetical protein